MSDPQPSPGVFDYLRRHANTVAASVVMLVVIVITTYVEGDNTERWRDLSDSTELQGMAERIDRIPLRVGRWKGEEIPDTEEILRQYKISKVVGHRNLSYRHVDKGTVVQVSIVCGHRRHVSIHTPDQCMIGAGFKFSEDERAESFEVAGQPVQVRTAQFYREQSSSVQNQRMVWCWAAFTGKEEPEWIGPEAGRVGLLAHPNWYKLYVTVSESGTRRAIDTTTARNFLEDVLPEINRELFGKSSDSTATKVGATEQKNGT